MRRRQAPRADPGVSARASRLLPSKPLRSTRSFSRRPSIPPLMPRMRPISGLRPAASITPARLPLITAVGPPDWPTIRVARDASSVGSVAAENGSRGSDEDPCIQPYGAIGHVLQIKLELLPQAEVAATRYLPQARQSRRDVEAAKVSGGV